MTPQTLTPVELDALDAKEKEATGCALPMVRAQMEAELRPAMRAALPALLAMARRLGEVSAELVDARAIARTCEAICRAVRASEEAEGRDILSLLAACQGKPTISERLTAATARVAELDAALTTALADAEMAEHAHDACEELLTAATARAEAANARAQAAEKRCGEMEKALDEAARSLFTVAGWRAPGDESEIDDETTLRYWAGSRAKHARDALAAAKSGGG